MKNLVLFIFVCVSFMGIAFPANHPKPLFVPVCQNEFDKLIKDFSSSDQWKEKAPAVPAQRAFGTPTAEIGHWLEAAFVQNGGLSLYEISAQATTEISFDENCKTRQKKKKGFDLSRNAALGVKAKRIDDATLTKILKKYKQGLIYLWSPGMVYSAKFFHRFQEVAKEEGLHFVPVLDPSASRAHVESMSREFRIPASSLRLNSLELYMRSRTPHFPVALAFRNGRLSLFPIIGVMEKSQLRALLKQQMETL